MKKNVKRFVSMTMAMLVAAGSLAGWQRFHRRVRKGSG